MIFYEKLKYKFDNPKFIDKIERNSYETIEKKCNAVVEENRIINLSN